MFYVQLTLHLNADKTLPRAPQEPPSLIICIDLERTLWGAHRYLADNVYQACMRIRCSPSITQKPLHYDVHRTKLATERGKRLDCSERTHEVFPVALPLAGHGMPDPRRHLRQ